MATKAAIPDVARGPKTCLRGKSPMETRSCSNSPATLSHSGAALAARISSGMSSCAKIAADQFNSGVATRDRTLSERHFQRRARAAQIEGMGDSSTPSNYRLPANKSGLLS